MSSDECLRTQCGTPGYVAPEILEGVAYGTKADMWSLGVITYILLGGYPPFIETNQRELFRKIRRGQFEFHAEYWGEVSAEAKDLIQSLLNVNPKQRLSASEALKNPWIRGNDEVLAGKEIQHFTDRLRKYTGKEKLKILVGAVRFYFRNFTTTEYLFNITYLISSVC